MKSIKEKPRSKGHERQLQRTRRIAERTPKGSAELDALVWAELVDLRALRAVATGIKWEIDHMLPVACAAVSGLHTHKNWQLIPSKMNTMKGDRPVLTEPDQWLAYADNFMRFSADIFAARLPFNGVSTRRQHPYRD